MKCKRFVMAVLLAWIAAPLGAVTLRYANQGDAVSLDPHSLNESVQLYLLGNVYEPLVGRGKQLELVPGLATEWRQTAPTVWRFQLRQGVAFHDGTPFTADDVIFSFERARDPGSDVKTSVQEIAQIRKLDTHAVEIVTHKPFPILPDVLTLWYMMSKKWCETQGAVRPVDKRKGMENAASFRTNGTGPFRVKSREPGVRTVLVRNLNYWGPREGNVDEAVFTPIAHPATRVAALLSGELDVIDPVPVQDIARVNADPRLKVRQAPELRTLFLGMDQYRDELLFSNVKGKNPFKDQRVRQAIYQAIDIDTIHKVVMRGASTPTGLMIAPGIRGFVPDLNRRLPYDMAAAKRLLSDAGYPDGFEVGLQCSNDRYVNDGAICQAVAQMLAKIGIKVHLTLESKATYFPKVLSRQTSFYLLAWTPNTYDAHNALNAVVATPDDKTGRGQFNLGRYSHPKIDALIDAIGLETDDVARMRMITEAMRLHALDVGHVPLHQQALACGMKKTVDLVQQQDSNLPLKWVTVR